MPPKRVTEYGSDDIRDDLHPVMHRVVMDTLYAAIDSPERLEWTVQGFGFLRCYPAGDKTWRVNVWHSSLIIPGVSVIHNHPWNFNSWILAGTFINQNYDEWDYRPHHQDDAKQFDSMRIKTGVDFDPEKDKSDIRQCWLQADDPVYFSKGDWYKQEWNEIHRTDWVGTCAVTINHRYEEHGVSLDHARVFWPHGEQWVDAKPRPATADEVKRVCSDAISLMIAEGN